MTCKKANFKGIYLYLVEQIEKKPSEDSLETGRDSNTFSEYKGRALLPELPGLLSSTNTKSQLIDAWNNSCCIWRNEDWIQEAAQDPVAIRKFPGIAKCLQCTWCNSASTTQKYASTARTLHKTETAFRTQRNQTSPCCNLTDNIRAVWSSVWLEQGNCWASLELQS